MTRTYTRIASAIAIACATASTPAVAQDHSAHHSRMSASEREAAKLHDLFVNKLICSDVKCPCTFRTEDAWRTLFGELKLAVVQTEVIRSLPGNVQAQLLYHLEHDISAETD